MVVITHIPVALVSVIFGMMFARQELPEMFVIRILVAVRNVNLEIVEVIILVSVT